MIIKKIFSQAEERKVIEKIRTLGLDFKLRRKNGTDFVEIVFDDAAVIDEEIFNNLILEGRRAHRLRNKDQYDTIGFENYTPAQINTYIDNNVTDLASVKVILKVFARLILYIIKHMDDDV